MKIKCRGCDKVMDLDAEADAGDLSLMVGEIVEHQNNCTKLDELEPTGFGTIWADVIDDETK